MTSYVSDSSIPVPASIQFDKVEKEQQQQRKTWHAMSRDKSGAYIRDSDSLKRFPFHLIFFSKPNNDRERVHFILFPFFTTNRWCFLVLKGKSRRATQKKKLGDPQIKFSRDFLIFLYSLDPAWKAKTLHHCVRYDGLLLVSDFVICVASQWEAKKGGCRFDVLWKLNSKGSFP